MTTPLWQPPSAYEPSSTPPPVETTQPVRGRSHGIRNVAILVGSVILTAALTTGIMFKLTATGPFAPQRATVIGTITVPPGGSPHDGESCTADDGYDDIAAGTQAVLANHAGETVGVGDLGVGTETSLGCRFPFRFTFMPDKSTFYSLTIGNGDRGVMKYNRRQLTKPLALQIGT